jgi:hypothetical protein
MYTCPPNLTLIPHRLQDHNVQSWKKVFFHCALKGQQSFEGQKTIFKNRYGMSLSIFLFLSEVGTCPQNLISTRGVEHWGKNHFLQGVCWNSHTKAIFWPKKRHIKNSWIENPNGENMLFGQILAVLGSFGQNLLHRQWLRACSKQGWNL